VNEFVNTWVFFKDLPALAESASSARVRAAAAACQAEAIQPVDSLVLAPDGRILGAFWVGDLQVMGPRPDFLPRPAPGYAGSDAERYGAFLEDMLARARE
jgi:hypothetical protein